MEMMKEVSVGELEKGDEIIFPLMSQIVYARVIRICKHKGAITGRVVLTTNADIIDDSYTIRGVKRELFKYIYHITPDNHNVKRTMYIAHKTVVLVRKEGI